MTSIELGLVVLSALLHASWSVLMKRSHDPLAFNVVQGLPTLVGLFAALPFFELRELGREALTWVAVSSVVHAFYLLWLSQALQRADLSLVYPIVRSTPAIVAFLAGPLLAERISLPAATGIAVVVAGVWLVQTEGRLRLRELVAPGALYAYLTLATTVGYSLSDKLGMAALEASPWSGPAPRAVVFYFLICGGMTLLFTPIAIRRAGAAAVRRSLRDDLGAACLASLMGFAGYGLILHVMRTAPVSYVASVRQTSVLFALLFSAVWLRERPSRPRALGAAATVGGVALIALYP
jgi:drug/metabolite transporter (DMT)-like permease